MGTLSFAQQIEVKGKVVDENGDALPGTSILIKGTTDGTQTGADGNFVLNVDKGATLVISFIGYKTQEVAADSASLSITLLENTTLLTEIVVTAQGVEKSKAALGYAISTVDPKETEQRPDADIARTLQGKISGVQISALDGSTGQSPTIRVRGNLSLTGSNAALIVVDNVPFSGSLINLDPNNIKKVTVLKGLNAALLYGSEGRNGVVLIETKSGGASFGKKSFTATIAQTNYLNKITNLPDFQDTYGVGNNFISAPGNNGSYGPSFDELDFIAHPYANNPAFPQFAGAVVPYEAATNNVEDFFKVGSGTVTSLNLSAVNETTAFNFSAGYTTELGTIGNNDLKRFNVSVGGKAKLTDKLEVSASLSYSTRVRNSQSGTDIFNNFIFIPRSLDIHNLPFQDPLTGANVHYRAGENPLWTLANTGRERTVDRMTTNINVKYKFNDHYSLVYRGGLQTENENVFDFRNRGGVGTIATLGALELGSDSEFDVNNSLILQTNYDLTDKIEFESQLGVNSRFRRGTSQSSDFTDQIVYGFFRPNNFRTNSDGDFDSFKTNLVGIFGQFEFNYDRYLYLNLSGRNDWGSTVESLNRSVFYPGVSVSFLPTSAFDLGLKNVDYLKVRAAYATSAGFPGAFSTRPILISDPRRRQDADGNLIVTNSLTSVLPNPNLRPELHKEFELGIEGEFFNNTIKLEASVFTRISEDQILSAQLDGSTGFTSTRINAGRVDTDGLEIDLGIKVFRKGDFKWDIRNTFTAFQTTVVELPGDNNLGSIILGESLGVFLGSYVVRDSEGNALINPNNGELLISDEVGLPDRIVGDINPDWRASTIHNLSYKDFSLTMQFEYTKGGDQRSDLVEQLYERGVGKGTENREGSLIIPGVFGDPATGLPLFDESGNTIPNNIQNNSNRTAFSNFYNPDESLIFDASVFRVREIALSYVFERKNERSPFKSIRLTVSGRNLFHIAPNFPKFTNIDPELNTSGGFRFPTTRRFSLGASFNF